MDKKTMRSILLRLGSYILRYKWLFLLALCMMFTSNIIALAGPKISGNAIDALTEKGFITHTDRRITVKNRDALSEWARSAK